jgi:hypothetical protein
MKLTILYHYFHPDDVVSARLFSELAVGLHEKGWEVEAVPCNRGCRDESRSYPRHEKWNGIAIRRIWRPRLPQAVKLGRLVNAWWMVTAWKRFFAGGAGNPPDVVLVGTDPFSGVQVAPFLRSWKPGIRIVHWCHDLYPDALAADGILSRSGRLYAAISSKTEIANQACDIVAGVGECMAERLEQYVDRGRIRAMTPWALWEPESVPPPNPVSRQDFFGKAGLGLLYSGNFGRAHTCDEFIALAEDLQRDSVRLCFAVRGNECRYLAGRIRESGADIRISSFTDESLLAPRLSSADIHLVSLKPEWSGVVAPSKFFAALAAGRPVIFAGPDDSSIARLIRKHEVGWVLNPETRPAITADLRKLVADPVGLQAMQARSFNVYRKYFSRSSCIAGWDRMLRGLVENLPDGDGGLQAD